MDTASPVVDAEVEVGADSDLDTGIHDAVVVDMIVKIGFAVAALVGTGSATDVDVDTEVRVLYCLGCTAEN